MSYIQIFPNFKFKFKMMKTILITVLFLFQASAYCQTSVNEVDRLCKKYTNGETVQFTNAQGSFTAKVKITYNEEGKPSKIALVGDVSFTQCDAVRSLIDQLVEEKTSKGYKLSSSNFKMYLKGSFYFKYYTRMYDLPPTADRPIALSMCYFEIENGDTKRIAGSGSKPIDF